MLGRSRLGVETTTSKKAGSKKNRHQAELSRVLGYLQDANQAAETLLQASKSLKESKYAHRFRQHLKASIDNSNYEHEKNPELALSIAVERSFALAFGNKQQRHSLPELKQARRKTGYNVFMTDYAKQMRGESHLVKVGGRGDLFRLASKAWNEMNADKKDWYERKADHHNNTSPDLLIRQTTQETPTALISDTEDAAVVEEVEEESAEVDQEFPEKQLRANLLESLHLEVAASTTRPMGRKKTYEVYQLSGPAMPVSDMAKMRNKLQKAFLTVYDGSTDVTDRCAARYSDCRVYATQRTDPKAIWIQINVGRFMDNETSRPKSGKHKVKRATETIAVVIPESSLVALTAGRSASRSRFTQYVLSAIEGALTCSVVGGYAPKGKACYGE